MQPYYFDENPGAFHGGNAIGGFQAITSKLRRFKISPHGQLVQPQELVAINKTSKGVQSVFIEDEIVSKQYDIIFSVLSPKALQIRNLEALIEKLKSFDSTHKFSLLEDADKGEYFIGVVHLPELDFAFNASKKELEAVFESMQQEAILISGMANKIV